MGPEVRVLKECYRFAPPLSPHLAARMAGVEIEPERILSACRHHRESAGDGLLVVEGIGGLLVPLTRLRVSPGRSAEGPGPALPGGLVQSTRDHQPHPPDPGSAPFQGPEPGGSGSERSRQPGESAGHRAVRQGPCRGGVGTSRSPLPGGPSRVRHPNSTRTGCWNAISWSPGRTPGCSSSPW